MPAIRVRLHSRRTQLLEMRRSATVPLSEWRNDLPPSAREARVSGSRWSALRKREQEVSARPTTALWLSADRSQKLRFRRSPLRVARLSRSLAPTPRLCFARRRQRERVRGSHEPGG